jgi:hypothetical protein
VELPWSFMGIEELAEELRDILFGSGRLFTGAYKKPKDRHSMYNSMVNAFERIIEAYQQKVKG